MTVRRGGLLSDERHRALAAWAAACAERVLGAFESYAPGDDGPGAAIRSARAWAGGEIRATESKVAAYRANASGRTAAKAAKYAAYSAGQAAAVAHVPEHALGAAAYAIRAVIAASPEGRAVENARAERAWQRSILPDDIRDLVVEDSIRRDDLCWNVFSL